MRLKLYLVLLCISYTAVGQGNNGLTVGDPVPDVVLKNIINHPSAEMRLSDHKEKLIIIDFWATWCGPCISSLKELNDLQKEFEGRLLVIPVTKQDKAKILPFITKKEWDLPFVIEDTVLHSMFPHKILPHQVWIKNGVVLSMPIPHYATAANISKVMNNETVSMYQKQVEKFDSDRPLLIMGNGRNGAYPVYYSTVTPRLANQGAGVSRQNNKLLVYNLSIPKLYVTAFRLPISSTYSRLILEVGDSLQTILMGPDKGESTESLNKYYQWQAENTYCYELYFNKGAIVQNREEALKKMYGLMEEDLNRFFGSFLGISGGIETRKVKCLALVRTRLNKSSRAKSYLPINENDEAYVLKNRRLEDFVHSLSYSHKKYPLPIIDATGMEKKFDLVIRGGLADLENVKKELKRYGLALQEVEHEVDMLVIRKVQKKF